MQGQPQAHKTVTMVMCAYSSSPGDAERQGVPGTHWSCGYPNETGIKIEPGKLLA